ncbi:MAG: L,D-transpeptidase [Nitrospira sp.]|jgi:L,D-transpeptidase YbiS|nr:MAG: L,D-transpeptidase [Nitrospira sp. CG24D]TKB81017.1 MAG: L,D-transpeptidase [Nitrospira sp.]
MKRVLLLIGSVLSFGLLVALIPYSSSQLQSSIASAPQPLAVDPVVLRGLQSQYKSLKKQLAQFAPHQHYILVDTARNHLYIKRSQEIVLDALASTGSGVVLDKPGEGSTQWVFDTPRGEFTVQSKLTHPAWVKPDWAFIEEGLMVPKNPADRVEQGVLGDYALGFGKGYFIHGTLYTRLLGKNVTHGCIRLNDDDLKSVYQLARVGTPIMIF